MKGIKGSTDEGGTRSPMIISWKGNIPSGKKVSKIASGIDLLPTLIDISGIKVKPKNKLDGVNLKQLIYQNDADWQERYIYNYWRGRLSLRSQNFRLDNENNLYNMNDDPNQLNNVSKTYKEIFEVMKKAKIEWKKELLANINLKDKRAFIIAR